MSRFSGKCDFCDEIEIFGLEMILKSDVYVGNSQEPIKLTCLEDCIPYYPYIVTIAVHNCDTNHHIIQLSEKSWVDIQEERYGSLSSAAYYREELRKELQKAAGGRYEQRS